MDFKVRCTKYIMDAVQRFTEGKVYEVKNGELTCDDGYKYTFWAHKEYGNADFEALRKWFEEYYTFELVEDKKVFTKNDLKTGMFGVMSNDWGYFVVVNDCLIFQNDGFERISLLTNDMCASYAHIERVYDGCTSFRNLESNECGTSTNATLVYDRKRDTKKFYNGKVVCVSNEVPDKLRCNGFTIGRIYEVKNGRVTSDDDWTCCKQYNSVEELSNGLGNKFIEIKE